MNSTQEVAKKQEIKTLLISKETKEFSFEYASAVAAEILQKAAEEYGYIQYDFKPSNDPKVGTAVLTIASRSKINCSDPKKVSGVLRGFRGIFYCVVNNPEKKKPR